MGGKVFFGRYRELPALIRNQHAIIRMYGPCSLWQAPTESPSCQSPMRSRTTPALGTSLALLFWVCGANAAEPSPAEKSSDQGASADFTLLEEYRLRIASHALPSSAPLGGAPGSGNQQTDQRLRLLGDGHISAADDHFGADLSGALWLDLDGASSPGTASLFATQYD